MKLYQSGLIIGKFMPLHRGHMEMIQEAINHCEQVTIMVVSEPDEPINGHLRYEWVTRTYPQCTVHHITEEMPVTPHDDPEYYEKWVKLVNGYGTFDVFYTGNDYEDTFARHLGVNFVSMDRKVRPISATMIRKDPFRYWEYLAPVARSHFALRICIMGPESTGKTTLAQQLAEHYHTEWVAEFARLYLEEKWNAYNCGETTEKPTWGIKEINDFFVGQMDLEEGGGYLLNRVLFCDTDPMSTLMWSETILGDAPPFLRRYASEHRYDLTVLTVPDLPYEKDDLRENEQDAGRLLQAFRKGLQSRRAPYITAYGRGEERLKTVIKRIDERFGDKLTSRP